MVLIWDAWVAGGVRGCVVEVRGVWVEGHLGAGWMRWVVGGGTYEYGWRARELMEGDNGGGQKGKYILGGDKHGWRGDIQGWKGASVGWRDT